MELNAKKKPSQIPYKIWSYQQSGICVFLAHSGPRLGHFIVLGLPGARHGGQELVISSTPQPLSPSCCSGSAGLTLAMLRVMMFLPWWCPELSGQLTPDREERLTLSPPPGSRGTRATHGWLPPWLGSTEMPRFTHSFRDKGLFLAA